MLEWLVKLDRWLSEHKEMFFEIQRLRLSVTDIFSVVALIAMLWVTLGGLRAKEQAWVKAGVCGLLAVTLLNLYLRFAKTGHGLAPLLFLIPTFALWPLAAWFAFQPLRKKKDK